MTESTQKRGGADPISPSTARIRWSDIEIFVFLALVALSAQGVLNYVFRNSPLVVWKQLLLCFLMALSAFRLRTQSTLFLTLFLSGVSFVLVLFSFINGYDFNSVFYTLFFFVSWIPFYVFGLSFNFEGRRRQISALTSAIILLSAIGIIIQFYTPFLDFLNDNAEARDYAHTSGASERVGFVFVASTLVLPSLFGILRLQCAATRNGFVKVVSLISLTFCAIATGSAAAFVILAGAAAMVAVRMKTLVRAAAVAGVALAGAAILTSTDNLVQNQLERVLSNQSRYSDSNEERIDNWNIAIAAISKSSFDQHVIGRGLGYTGKVFSPNGLSPESSFMAAYLEGGVVGLALALLPFTLALSGRNRIFARSENWIYVIFLFAACAVAPIFASYGVQCTLGFIAGLCNQRLNVDVDDARLPHLPAPSSV